MALVANDQFTWGEEEFMTRMWAADRIKGNAEGPGFEKDRNLSSPKGRLLIAVLGEWAATAVFTLVTSFRIHVLRKSIWFVHHGLSIQQLVRIEKNTLIYNRTQNVSSGGGIDPPIKCGCCHPNGGMNVEQSKIIAVPCKGQVRLGQQSIH